HPEQRTGAADADRRRNADDIARADRRSQRRGERLELRDVAVGSWILPGQKSEPQCRAETDELQTAQPDRQIEAGAEQEGYEEPWPPYPAAESLERALQSGEIHECSCLCVCAVNGTTVIRPGTVGTSRACAPRSPPGRSRCRTYDMAAPHGDTPSADRRDSPSPLGNPPASDRPGRTSV